MIARYGGRSRMGVALLYARVKPCLALRLWKATSRLVRHALQTNVGLLNRCMLWSKESPSCNAPQKVIRSLKPMTCKRCGCLRHLCRCPYNASRDFPNIGKARSLVTAFHSLPSVRALYIAKIQSLCLVALHSIPKVVANMGGWSDQPYIYPTCTPLSERKTAYPYSSFNPRASTQAAYQAIYDQNRPKPQQNGPLLRFDQPSNPYMVTSGNGDVHYTPAAYEALQAKKKTKPEGKGPLINFNQHPDSWMVVNAQSVKYKPMPANTKKKVTILRWIQFALRILEEAGALGTLIMLICFTNMPTTFSWIMRIAVGRIESFVHKILIANNRIACLGCLRNSIRNLPPYQTSKSTNACKLCKLPHLRTLQRHWPPTFLRIHLPCLEQQLHGDHGVERSLA